jgi:inosose dehydratase
MQQRDAALHPAVSEELWMGPLVRERTRDAPMPLPNWLAQAKQAGYAGIELQPHAGIAPREFAAMLEDGGLRLAGAPFVGGLLELTLDAERRRVAPVLERALAAGRAAILYTEFTREVRSDETVSLDDRPQPGRDELRRYGEKLTKLADWLAGEGSTLAYLPRLGTLIESRDEIDLLMVSSDTTVRLALDLGAAAIAGIEAADLIRQQRERFGYLRLQSVDEERARQGRDEGWSFPRLLREGVHGAPSGHAPPPDLAALGRALIDVGYRGWAVVAAEGRPSDREPATVAADARDAVERLMQELTPVATEGR